MDFNDETPPLTPTKSELDTFQVLSNAHFVNFNKDKPNSKLLKMDLDEKSPKKMAQKLTPPVSPEKTEETFVHNFLNPEDEFIREDFEEYDEAPKLPSAVPTESEIKQDYYENKDHWGMDDVPIPPPPPFSVSPTKKPQVSGHSPKYVPPSKKYEDDNDSVNTELLLEIESEKEALLQELSFLESQGVYVPIRRLTMKDKLEEIQFQYDKAQSELNTNQGVEMVKSGIKMGSVMLEFALKKFGITLVEGFSANLNKDPSKFNRPLTKLYKKYWRRGSSSPEMELAMIVLGSLAWTMIQNKMHGVGNAKPEIEEKKAPLPVPPKVNLQQFQKEKEMQNKINELEKKIQLMKSDIPDISQISPLTTPRSPKIMISPSKKVNLKSMDKKTKSQIRL